jgi:hypothetical protein
MCNARCMRMVQAATEVVGDVTTLALILNVPVGMLVQCAAGQKAPPVHVLHQLSALFADFPNSSLLDRPGRSGKSLI